MSKESDLADDAMRISVAWATLSHYHCCEAEHAKQGFLLSLRLLKKANTTFLAVSKKTNTPD